MMVILGLSLVFSIAYAVMCRMQINQLRQQLEKSANSHTQAPPTPQPTTPAKTQAQDTTSKKLRQQVQALTQQLQELQQKDNAKNDDLINDQKNRISELSKQLETALQQQKQQQEQQKELPLDLQKLPQHVLPELARVYRKAQHNEQLVALTRSKLHMAQEKHNDLQKRYFSVCRELAKHAKEQPAQTENIASNTKPQENQNAQQPSPQQEAAIHDK